MRLHLSFIRDKSIVFLLISLIYMDSIESFPEIFSILWKVAFLSFPILFFLIRLYGNVQIFIFAFLLCTFKLVFHSNFGYGLAMDINEALKLIVVPIFAIFIGSYPEKYSLSKLKQQLVTHKQNLIWFIFILFSLNVLFLLDILPQFGMMRELDRYGISMYPLNGIFYHVSISSKVFALLGIIVMFSRTFIIEHYNRLIYYYLYILSVLSIILAFTRTGWVLFLFALIYNVVINRQLRVFIFTILIFFIASIAIPNLSEGIKNRLINTPKTSGNLEELNELTSGRVGLYKASYEIFKELNLYEKLIGIGKKETLNKMNRRLRVNVVPHNRFIELLLYGGIINILLFFVAIMYLLYFSFNSKVDVETQLVRAMFCVFIISLFPSHGLGLYGNALFGYVLGLKILKDKIIDGENSNLISSTN